MLIVEFPPFFQGFDPTVCEDQTSILIISYHLFKANEPFADSLITFADQVLALHKMVIDSLKLTNQLY